MLSTSKYSVHLITESDQLTKALSLRHNVNKNVNLKLREKTNRAFESDSFDNRSLHIGLYYNNGNKNELAGYCRLILPENFESDYLKLLISKNPENLKKCTESSDQKLACQELLTIDDYELLNSFCMYLEDQKIVYSETSHFIVDEKHRNQTTCSLFVSYLFDISESLNIEYTFFSSSPQEVPLHSKYGLISFAGIKLLGKNIQEENLFVFGINLKLANADKPKTNLLKAKTYSRGIKWSGVGIQEKFLYV